MKLGKYAKSAAAAVTAGAATLGTALADDKVTSGEWVGVALAVLGALGIVYAVPNKAGEARTGGWERL